ncbi:MAG TPA: hypothetical protein PKD86_03415 [Gemmatales bacterium]|nr:hypothetical protein [Gemmatales bacterium]HMP58382.1 hypothetical protein [Gemmatales bacterium]
MRAGVTLSLLLVVIVWPAHAEPPLVERFLHSGKLAEGERALERALELDPDQDQLRFGLGMVRFVRAVERLGQSFYEHGVKSESTNLPFLRIPVPVNPDPTPISHPQLRRILMQFGDDLAKAEATLAGIKDREVRLPLRLAAIRLDLRGDGQSNETLLAVLKRLMRVDSFPFLKSNPEFLVVFDRGDVAWLRAYCHMLSAIADLYLAFDTKPIFDHHAQAHFASPKGQSADAPDLFGMFTGGIRVVEPRRLHTCRLHLVQLCELNHETWRYIRAEKDNDFEWLPSPKQTGVFGLPITDQMIDGWLAGMSEIEGLLKGEKILVLPPGTSEYGVNLRTFFDHPPENLVLMKVMQNDIDPRFLVRLTPANRCEGQALNQMMTLFDGPLSFAYMAWFN